MNRFRVSDAAQADLEDIWIYVARDDTDAADKLIRSIASRFSKLASMPELGRRREELLSGVRSFPVGTYIIFYSPMADGIEVTRILHGARNFPPIFE